MFSIVQVDFTYTQSSGDRTLNSPLSISSELYIGGVPTDNNEVMQYIRTNKLTYTIQDSQYRYWKVSE